MHQNRMIICSTRDLFRHKRVEGIDVCAPSKTHTMERFEVFYRFKKRPIYTRKVLAKVLTKMYTTLLVNVVYLRT